MATENITVALDVMGSDLGPEALVAGAAYLSLRPRAPDLCLVGDADIVARLLKSEDHDRRRVEIVPASDLIGMNESPKQALIEKPNASIAVAARLVRDGQADALVSAGNTGAMALACVNTFERLPSVRRCALGAVYPTERRRGEKDDPFSLILDAGLTLDVDAMDLVTFAVMGSAYAARISSNPRPRVALLSNGSEDHKGTAAIVEANRRLRQMKSLNFIGNVEGMDIPRGTADVVVTGGFTGNIVLKMLEGISETMVRLGRYAMHKSIMYKAGLALLSPAVKQLRRITDWEQYGGAPILGFDHPCIKAHGRSSPRAIANAVKVAAKATRTEMVQAIRLGLAEAASGD